MREVERRGIHEVGIYRVSGSASDLNRLKKSFETSKYCQTKLQASVFTSLKHCSYGPYEA